MFPTRRITTSGGDKFRDEFSLAFDGTNDYINLSGTFNYNIHSISIWVKETATSGQSTIFDYRDKNNDGINFYLAAGQPLYAVNSVDAHYTTNIGLNQWTHIVLTNDGSTSTIYVNGVSVETADTSSETIDVTSSTLAKIGRDAATGNYFTGNISEIAIYNKALSASEATTLYNGREPYNHKEGVCSSNLQAWWRMGDGVLDDRNGLVADQTNATIATDLVTDGNFPNGDNWTENSWSISSNKASLDGTQGGVVNLIQTGFSTIQNKTVKVVFDITDYTAGNVTLNLGGNPYTTSGSFNSVGVHTFYAVITGDSGYLLLQGDSSFNGSVSNISMQILGGNAGVTTNMDADAFGGDTP